MIEYKMIYQEESRYIMLKHVLFDVDGTLTDPLEGIINAILYALPRMGIEPPADPKELKVLVGPPMLEALQEYFHLSREDAQRMLTIYREYYTTKGLFEATLHPGIPELLQALHDRGIQIHTATSKPIEFVEPLLRHFHLRDYFTFLGADDLACSRHSKDEVIAYVLQNIPDITPENTVMVGDRKYDVLSASRFGLRTVGCAFGHAEPGELEQAGAAYIAHTASETQHILLSL